jgi:hypothetical protein
MQLQCRKDNCELTRHYVQDFQSFDAEGSVTHVNEQEVANVSKNYDVFTFREGSTILWNASNYLSHDKAPPVRTAEPAAWWCVVHSTVTNATCTHTTGQAHKILQATAKYKLQNRTLLKSTCFGDSHSHHSPKCRTCYSTGHSHSHHSPKCRTCYSTGHSQSSFTQMQNLLLNWTFTEQKTCLLNRLNRTVRAKFLSRCKNSV